MPHQTSSYQVNKSVGDYDFVTLSSSVHPSTYTSEASMAFISLRCLPTLFTLPPELLSKIASNLSLYEYSYLSRTCSRFHRQLFHPAEMVHFLKKRYRLSIESGSIIIFAYLANMQIRAPLLLERIFEDFFADSPLRLQEDEKARRQHQKQMQLLNHNTQELNHSITGGHIGSHSSIVIQRMDSLQAHKAAEKTRRQAKWDAVRMLGVLYALDKTHVGVTQLTNPGSLSHRQLVARKAGRSLSQEGHDFPRAPSLETDPYRSLSHKRGHRNRPSPLLGSRGATIQSCGSQNRDRSLSQSHEECVMTFSSQSHSSESGPSLSPPACSSPWQEFSSTKVGDSIGHLNVQKAASVSGSKRCPKQRPKEGRINDKIVLEGEWEGMMNQQGGEKRDANDQDIEMRDLLVNMNDLDYCQCTGPYAEAQASGSNISYVPSKDYPLTRSGYDNWVESSMTFSGSASRLDAARSFAGPSGSEASPIMESPSNPLTVPSEPMSSRAQSTASFGEGGHWQNERQSQPHQPILNRSDKIAFLTKYTDRMHRKLQALEIKDWRNEDIQRKKTYQLMIQHNDKSGEKDLVDFYLGRYGGSVQSNQERLEQQGQHHRPVTTVAATMAI
ncbi:hypothetical protein BGX26_001653 [Mortierella sp. AD094]|nr:hypothetical protein BGX26_001653 [Mortierella sp. AD094]